MKKLFIRDYTGIDIFKFIFSIAIVAVHVSVHSIAGGGLPSMMHWLAYPGLPFFFIVSGFLVANKTATLQKDAEIRGFFRHRSFKLFRIYGYWLLIYLPITIYITIRDHCDIWKSLKGYVFGVLFDGQSEYAWPLWFIYSMAIVFLIFSFFRTRKLSIIVLLFFAMAIVIEWCYRTLHIYEIEYVYRLTYRTLGGGLYITVGMFLYRYPVFRGIKSALICICLSIALFIYDLPFWELFGGFAFANLAIIIQLSPSKIYLRLRNLSMWIYFTHMYPIFFIAVTCKLNDIYLGLIPMFLLAIVSTLIISFALSEISMKSPKAKWLNSLIK